MRDGFAVVDAHTHVFRRPTRCYRPIHFTVDDLVASMDRYGVDVSTVLARPTSSLRAEELRDYHDELARDVAKYPDRLTPFCWVAPRLEQAGVDEVRRCLLERGYRGLKLHPAQEMCNMDDADVYPFLEVAREHNAPV